MPIDAGAVGVRPALRPQASGGVDGVTRRENDGSAEGFRPQTNVVIKNAIDDMAGVLSKIATNENEALADMPQDLQKMLQNVLKNAFSFDETLAEGLGSTMESQRFSMDQLASVARTLSQMATLAEKGYDVDISDGLQTLLQGLKEQLTTAEGGKALEPVLILKESFELLNGKEVEELPSALRQLLQQLGSSAAQTPSASAGSAALKQLLQYFMPKGAFQAAAAQASASPAAAQGANATAQGESAAAQGESAAQPGANQPGANQPEATGKPATATASQAQSGGSAANPQASTTTAGRPQQTPDTATQTETPADAETPTAPTGNGAAKTAAQTGEPTAQPLPVGKQQDMASLTKSPASTEGMPAEDTTSPSQPGTSRLATPPEGDQEAALARQAAPDRTSAQAAETKPEAQVAKTFTAQEAKELLMQQPFENSARLMTALKETARTLLQDETLSPQEAQVLQNFLKESGETLSPKEARQLETLLRLAQQNIPATVQQAAVQRDLPELSRLWIFLQLCDLTTAKRMSARQLKKAGHDVSDFATSMRNSMEGEHAIGQGQRSMNFMMPLYLGTNEKSYPAYLHVYDENQTDHETGAIKKETWLRLCVLTDYLGAVELTCRVYEREHLDLRLFFMGKDAAQQFRGFVPELRQKMRSSKLHLEDIAVGAANE